MSKLHRKVNAPIQPTTSSLPSQRLKLNVLQWGSTNDDDPVIVLVHGIQDHARTWDALVERVQEWPQSYRIIAPDLRGHGDSQWVRGSGYQYLDHVYDLYHVIRERTAKPVTLIGHSLGGAITALFAGIFPEHVQRLVSIEGIGIWQQHPPNAGVIEHVREWVEKQQALASRLPRSYPDLAGAVVRMHQANPGLTKAQAQHLTEHGMRQDKSGDYVWKYDNYTYNFNGIGFSHDQTIEIWQNISCPTLLINASDGLECRHGQNGTLVHFNDVRLEVVEAAGHWTFHDQPEAVVTLLADFLSPTAS